MTPYPYYKDMSADTYFIMNRTGNSFYRWNSETVEDENHVALRQFEAYFNPVNDASANFAAFSLFGEVIGNETTDVSEVGAATDGVIVRGGNRTLMVTSDHSQTVNVVSVDGRVSVYNVKAGTTHISVPAGVYIVNGKKVLVR